MQRALCLAGLLAFVIAAGVGAFASSAQAYVYWAEFGGGNGTQIWRANLDGSGSRPWITNAEVPCGVAVNADHIYWGNARGSSIGRANLDGTGVDQRFISLAPGSQPCGVALNGSQVWWTSSQVGADSSSVGRANLDGTGVVLNLFNTPQVRLPCRLAVNSSHVFWVNNFGTTPNIWRAGLDGTPPPAEIVPDAAPETGSRSACWPTLNGARLYWWSYPEPGIVSSDLEGSDRRTVLGASAAGGIAFLGGQIYFASALEDSISRANLDGTDPDLAFVKAKQPFGLAVDSGIPLNHFSLRKLRRNKSKGTAILLARIPNPGRFSMVGRGVVRRRGAETVRSLIGSPGSELVKLRIKAKNRKLRKLDRTGRVELRLKVTFSPTGGTPSRTKRRPVTLIQR